MPPKHDGDVEQGFSWVRRNFWFLTLVVTVSAGGLQMQWTLADLARAEDQHRMQFEAHVALPDHAGGGTRAAVTEAKLEDVKRRLDGLEAGQTRLADNAATLLSELRAMRAESTRR